jgi:hypothetical protein
MVKVSHWLAEQTEPVSRNAIEKARLGKQKDYVRVAIDELVAAGYVIETAGPRNARLYESTRIFTSPDFAPTSPAEVASSSPDFASPLQGAKSTGEDEDRGNGAAELDLSYYDHLADELRAEGLL